MAFTPFQVKAVYEYTSPHEDDLHFPNGQIITVVEEEDEDWYAGEYTDANGVKQEGIFPRNFVERYTPQAPPRPNRAPRPKKVEEPVAETAPAPAPAPAPEPAPVAKAPEPVPALPPAPVEAPEPVQAPAAVPIPAAAKPVEQEPTQSPPAPKAAPAQQAAVKSPPPPAAEKPISGSFRDRIAAFNKAAPPPVPYKPGGNGGGSGFIKKPFVAPPPSKNAYIPPPQQAPVAKIYRRDEDPEIAAREQEDRDIAEKAGLAPASNEGEEAQPKPTSLKERIALLQKQQAEQAARHAESSAAKKEKPKKPVKKRSETDAPVEGEEAPSEQTQTHETTGGRSIDDSTTEEHQIPVRRKSSRGPPPPPPARVETDGNDADMSGAGDETEGQDTPIDDPDRAAKQQVAGHPPPPPPREPDVGDEEDTTEDAQSGEDEEEDEDDIDPELRRKEEIRARMAKMSGGMGMMGIFGGGMPMPGPAPPKKKKTAEKQHSEEHGEVTSPSTHPPPIPVFPMPGLTKVKSPEQQPSGHEDDKIDEPSQAPATPGTITGAHAPDEVADIEDVAPVPPPHTERPVPSRRKFKP